MKALSLKQPFAELILLGRKQIELRKWNTKYRGEFMIHASKIPDKEAMKKFQFNNLPTGQIVGKATIIDIKKYSDAEEFNKDKDKHLASEDYCKYGFILANVKRIKPMICKGKLGFWNYEGII